MRPRGRRRRAPPLAALVALAVWAALAEAAGGSAGSAPPPLSSLGDGLVIAGGHVDWGQTMCLVPGDVDDNYQVRAVLPARVDPGAAEGRRRAHVPASRWGGAVCTG